MTNIPNQNKSILPTISGGLFAFCALESVFYIIRLFGWFFNGSYDYRFEYVKTIALNSAGVILLILLAISLFIRRPMLSGASLSGLAVVNLYYFVNSILQQSEIIWIVSNFFSFAAFAFSAAIFFIIKSGNTSIKCVWFLPAVFSFLGNIYPIFNEFRYIFADLIKSFSYLGFGTAIKYIFQDVIYIFSCIAEVMALLLMCMWICEKLPKPNQTIPSPYGQTAYQSVPVTTVSYPQQNVYQAAPQTNQVYQPIQQPTINLQQPSYNAAAIESELTTLKYLLDNGIITYEEFEIKKKQILGI